jgi:hypothetical protein
MLALSLLLAFPLRILTCSLFRSDFSEYSGGGEDGNVRGTEGLALRVGVGEGVTSVEGVTSTNSASRYHFLRRV